MTVAKDLNFNVARAQHVFLDQHGIVAKAVDGFALAAGQSCRKILALFHQPHALAATACAGLDQHRVADAIGLALQQLRILITTVVTGHQRHASLVHQALGLRFQTHGANRRSWWADKHQSRRCAGIGKVFVLTQKTVAGVNGFGARLLGGLQNALPAQIAVLGRTAANVYRLITGGHMLGLLVGVGVDSDGFHPHAAGSGSDTAGDFTAIGNQDLFKHGSPPQ